MDLKHKTLIGRTSIVALFYVGAVGSQFFADLFFARHSIPAEFGLYAFVKQSAVFIMSVAFLGLDQAIIRIVAREDLGRLAWKDLWLRVSAISCVLSIVCSIVLWQIYPISIGIVISVAVISMGMLLSLLTSSFFRADQQFVRSQVIQNSWRYSLAGILIVAYVLGSRIGTWAIGILIASASIGATLAVYTVIRTPQVTSTKLRLLPIYKEALIFWLFSSSLVLVNSLDQFILGRISSFDAVGHYTAIWNIVGSPYLALASTLGYIGLPLSVRGERPFAKASGNIIPFAVLGTVAAACIWWFVSPIVIELVYSGKYPVDRHLVSIFSVSGVIQLVYTIPSVIIGGRAGQRLLIKFLAIALSGIVLHFLLATVLVPSLGVTGAALGSLSDWLVRCGGGIILILLYRDDLIRMKGQGVSSAP